jgi:CheY-like chemotaxis protein
MVTAADDERRRVLLVDDDPLVLRIYEEGLTKSGLEVEALADGLEAIKALAVRRYDAAVLDLMMPKFSGVDVLKFIRSKPELVNLPVVVLSSAYMPDLVSKVTVLGPQRSVLKRLCTPRVLAQILDEIWSAPVRPEMPGLPAGRDKPAPGATPVREAQPGPIHLVRQEPPRAGLLPAAEARGPAAGDGRLPGSGAPAYPKGSPILSILPHNLVPPAAAKEQERESQARAREEFARSGPATCAALRGLFQALQAAQGKAGRDLSLRDLYRKTHLVSTMSGMAGCETISQVASVGEALLFQLSERPSELSPSVMRTIGMTVDFIAWLFERTPSDEADFSSPARALVVDDDAISNRVIVGALSQARVQIESAGDALSALRRLGEKRYELILLDVVMPGMDGFELCTRIRALPGYSTTPVIFVTAHENFQNLSKGFASGGDDLISKPVLPLELVAKVVMHLIRAQLDARERARESVPKPAQPS